MFRKILLMLFLCGLTAVSVVLSYKASAATYACQVAPVCRFPETPPPCETLPCRFPSVQWQKQMTDPVMRSPQVFPQRWTDAMLCRLCSLRMSCGQ